MKKLLIVVDMLNDFCATEGVLAKSLITGEYYGRDIVMKVLDRVALYRDTSDPIIWLGDAHAEDDAEFDRFPKHAVKGSWGAEIVDALNPGMVDASAFELYIPKTRYSGFFGTDLEYQLMRLAPKQVEVIGVCTSICVMDTVGGLANRDYDTVVYRDCVADFDRDNHSEALLRMSTLYGAQVL